MLNWWCYPDSRDYMLPVIHPDARPLSDWHLTERDLNCLSRVSVQFWVMSLSQVISWRLSGDSRVTGVSEPLVTRDLATLVTLKTPASRPQWCRCDPQGWLGPLVNLVNLDSFERINKIWRRTRKGRPPRNLKVSFLNLVGGLNHRSCERFHDNGTGRDVGSLKVISFSENPESSPFWHRRARVYSKCRGVETGLLCWVMF